jgi:16S rRNA (cytosine967-C5)-methyltransferase
VHLRVNPRRGSVEEALERLRADGIEATEHPAARMALEVVEGARRLRNAEAYQSGLVELQDAASQAVVEQLPLSDGMKVLDYCAGGGGKALAMAAQADIDLFAHDADPRRMKDLPQRAARAGAEVSCLATDALDSAGPFDLVLCDVPCSGSGSWRRAPEGKWRLTAERLQDLYQVQANILREAARLTAPGGYLAYATCSMLRGENAEQVQRFLQENAGWKLVCEHSWKVQDGTDGFHVAVLTRQTGDC